MPQYQNFSDPRARRLAKEHEWLDDYCRNSDLVRYEVAKQRPGFPPEEYRIYYKLRSITHILPDGSPQYGNEHVARISLPTGYPMTSSPVCYMETPVWHPNIRSSGEYRGHICINKEVLGHWHTLDMLVEQIGEMLQYKNYHALNEIPFPEDSEVAKWVREHAEPKGIVSKIRGIFTDSRPLQKPSPDWLEKRQRKAPKMQIRAVKKGGDPSGESSAAEEAEPAPERPARPSIRITPKDRNAG